MNEKIKELFSSKNKKIENLISFLIIAVITLIIINKIIYKQEKNEEDFQNMTGVELAKNKIENEDDLEKRLEEILEKIDGIENVSVLITYSESESIVPIYNTNLSTSKIEENDSSGGVRVTETENKEQDIIKDSDSNIILEKNIAPKIEGAIITANGVSNSENKNNIIMAVEAVTGLATYKIQVFERGEK